MQNLINLVEFEGQKPHRLINLVEFEDCAH